MNRAKVKKVTFTGTRNGMNITQLETVEQFLKWANPQALLHGGCKGADEQVHILALQLGVPVIVYPSNDKDWQGCFEGAKLVKEPAPPLERNRAMLKRSRLLIAAPAELVEQKRGGTWYTMRYAQKLEMGIDVAWADGGIGFRRPWQPLSRLDVIGQVEWQKQLEKKREKNEI